MPRVGRGLILIDPGAAAKPSFVVDQPVDHRQDRKAQIAPAVRASNLRVSHVPTSRVVVRQCWVTQRLLMLPAWAGSYTPQIAPGYFVRTVHVVTTMRIAMTSVIPAMA
jgi:hypothetical protein